MSDNPWDSLGKLFASDDSQENIPSAAADNILIAWPVILNFINHYAAAAENKRALDYGCGGGRFAAQLNEIGYKAFGIDSAEAMVADAKKHYGKQVTFVTGDEQVVTKYEPFDLITSLMALEFIYKFEEVLSALAHTLNPGGLFVFAVHNPEHVRDCLQSPGSPYVDFDSVQNPTKGTLRFGDVGVPLFLRSASQYRSILDSLGLSLLLEEQPPFTQEFLSKYPTDGPTQHSEYLILGFRKTQ
jgi:SAM-dependent methyltransferase